MRKLGLVGFVPFVLACLGLAGCDDSYSAAVRYLLRTDPLVMDPNKLGEEQHEPDRPGQLPLFSPKDVLDLRNPLFKQKDTLFTNQDILRDPTRLGAADRKSLQDALDNFFGTPAKPKVDGIDDEVRTELKLSRAVLARGSKLYRLHCLHCHGVSGDGRGPTARWVNPHPRDYRQLWFKFQTTDQSDGTIRPPRRDDIVSILVRGIEGTAMPTFALLPPDQLDDLASYVLHLGLRGRVEFDALKDAFGYDKDKKRLVAKDEEFSAEEYIERMVQYHGNKLLEAQKKKIKVEPMPFDGKDRELMKKSVQRGYQMFLGEGNEAIGVKAAEAKAANCAGCHKDLGRQSQFKFDAWGTMVRPPNLVVGQFRGGRKAEDIYYRMHSGINGSGMANFGGNLSTERLWDLVNFVQALPYPAMRKAYEIKID